MVRRNKLVGVYTVNFKRDIQKSVRLDSRIYRYIMQSEGSDFTEKLENLVIDHAGFTDKLSDLIH